MRVGSRGRPPKERTLELPEEPTALAYLAGIIDGEGSISTLSHSRQRRWSVTIANTSDPLIEWLWAFGGTLSLRRASTFSQKPCWMWTVTAWRDTLYLLEQVRPYLRIKADRADEAIIELRLWIEEADA